MPTTTTGIATSFIDFTRASNATVTDSDGRVKWAPHNLLLASESFNAWNTASGVVAPPTVTANNVVAPNGTQTADRIAIPAVSGTNANSIIFQYLTQVFSTPHTFGVYLRGDVGGEVVWIGWTPDGVSYARTQCTLTTSWQLFTVNYTTSASGTQVHLIGVDLRDASQSAKGAQTIYAWGAAVYRSDLAMQPNTSAYPLYNPTTPKNLLGFTEDFSNAYWIKGGFLAFGSGSTVNATIAPNGLPTGDLLTPDTTVGLHRVVGPTATVLSGTPFRYTVYVKPNGYTKVAFREMATTGDYAAFSLTGAGSVIDKSASATASISALPDGWYLISTSIAAAATLIRYTIYVLDPSYTSGTVEVNWTPNGTSGIYLWGAQFSDSASLDSYVPVYGAAVTSAAYYGPRRDFDGATLACKGLLVEELRTNLLLYSTDFLNATYWSLYASATVAANSIVSPDGLTTSYTVTGSGSNFSSLYQNRPSTNGATYTSSVYVKAGTATFAFILLDAGVSARWVNLSTGEITGSAGPIVSAVATPVGNGWYRVAIAYTATGTTNAGLFVGPASASLSQTSTGTIYAWSAQTELGSFGTSYIPTTGAATATRNADVASVSTQAFPYSASESTLVASVSALAVYTGGILRLGPSAGNNGLRLYQNNSTFRAYVDTGSFVSIGTATPNTVQKMALAYNGATNGAVLDGGTVSSVGTTVAAVAEKLEIGGLSNSSDYFCGHIRQVTYLPRRVTNAELQTRTA